MTSRQYLRSNLIWNFLWVFALCGLAGGVGGWYAWQWIGAVLGVVIAFFLAIFLAVTMTLNGWGQAILHGECDAPLHPELVTKYLKAFYSLMPRFCRPAKFKDADWPSLRQPEQKPVPPVDPGSPVGP